MDLPTGINTLFGVVLAIVVFTLGVVLSFVTRSNPYQTLAEWMCVWGFAGTRNLRRTFQVCFSTAAQTILCWNTLHDDESFFAASFGNVGGNSILFGLQVDPKPWQVTLHVITYDIPIKYCAPAACLGLFVQQILVDANDYENGYKNYPDWLHGVVGGLVLGALVFSLLIFAVYPQFWDVMGIDENQGAQVAHYAVRFLCLPFLSQCLMVSFL